MTNLSVLCASHIESGQRLIYLEYMLQSWYKQSKPCKLYLSISYSENLKVDVSHLTNSWKTYTNLFNVTMRSSKLSQFEHYRLLLTENDLDWIIFTDDDDLWNTIRVEKYLQCEFKDKQIYCIDNTFISYDLYSTNIFYVLNDSNAKKYCVCEYLTICLQAKKCLNIINDIIEGGVSIKEKVFDLKFRNWIFKYYSVNTIESETCLYWYRLYNKHFYEKNQKCAETQTS